MDILEDNLLFNRIRLIDSVDIELKVSADTFRGQFEKNVLDRQETYGLRRPKKEFQGKIKRDSFRIARTYSAFETDVVGAEGTYKEDIDILKVQLWIYLPFTTFLIFYAVIILINIFTIYQVVIVAPFSRNPIPFIIALILFFSWTMFIPYFASRKSIKKLKIDLEREFHFWLRETNAPQQKLSVSA